MSELAAGFQSLPTEYQDVIRLAQDRYHISVTPLQVLTGGFSGAVIYLASVALEDPARVEHFVLKLDHKNEKARADEIQRHQDAARLSPPEFAAHHMAQMQFERVEQAGAVAIFYSIAGHSLHQYRPLSAFESQSQLETLFAETTRRLLGDWNAKRAFRQGVHPQQILEQWLAFRVKRGAFIDQFLETVCQVPPDLPGVLIESHIYPNPLVYAREPERWGGARPLDVLTGLHHGDLNTNNILVKFDRGGKTVDGFYLIDFALFKEQLPLLYDLRYLEFSYLVMRLSQVPFRKMIDLFIRFGEADIADPLQVPVETAGLCALLNASRQAFQGWVSEHYPSLGDDLWGQYLLAGVAAGLSFCHKTNLSNEERMAGLVFAATSLKRYATLFDVPAPTEGRRLYDPGQWPAAKQAAATSPSQAEKTPRSLPSGRTLAFLFTDLVGSTQLWELYPQAMRTTLRRHDELLREAVESARGQVVKNTGDGVLAVFTTVLDGVRACLKAQQSLAAEPWGETGRLSVRMGLHAGEAQLREGDYYGPAVNRAVRLMGAAHGGQVLLSSAAVNLLVDQLPTGVSLRDLGEHRLRGLDRPEHIYQLVHESLPSEFPPLAVPDFRPNNLPPQATPLIGRKEELREVLQRLADPDVRLLTLTGPGGIGKTRLALQTATSLLEENGRFKDGVYFVDLADATDPDAAVAKIAQALGVRESSQPLIQTLKHYLSDKRLVLLLDNLEQVVSSAPMIVYLLAFSPGLKVLATSRVLLQVRGENEIPVPPMKIPDPRDPPDLDELEEYESVRLFVERARAANPRFQLTREVAPAVIEICSQLDGLPLAIELAAARIKMFPPQALLRRLGNRLSILTGGARDLPERQQTLRNTLDWSHSLLRPEEQVLFARLAVFVGGFTLDVAEAVCNPDGALDVMEGVSALLNNSLLRQESGVRGQPRFRMLEIMREYALEKLRERGELAAMQQSQAHYYFKVVTQEAQLFSAESIYWLDWLESEHANLQAVLAWCQSSPDGAWMIPTMAFQLTWYWYRRGYINEGRSWTEQWLSSPVTKGHTRERAMALLTNAQMALWRGDLHTAMARGKESLELLQHLEDEYGIPLAMMSQGIVHLNMGDDAAAQPFLRAAQQLFEESGRKGFNAATLVHLGNAALGLGNPEEAGEWLDRSAVLSHEIGDPWQISFVENNRGEVARVQGDYAQARRHYEESEVLLRSMGDKGDLARLVNNLGYVAKHEGDLPKAWAQFQESLAMFRQLGNKRGIAESLAGLATVRAEEGRHSQAARLLGAAEAMLAATGARWWPADRLEISRCRDAVRMSLGEEAFAAELAVGQELTFAQVMALAADDGG